jgi:hypothetical protein
MNNTTNTQNANTVLRIKSIHNRVGCAVLEAELDLSFNPQLAWQDIAELDMPRNRDSKPVTKAYVTEDNEVYYVYECDITLLNKLELFSAGINNTPFSLVVIDEANGTITITPPFLKKNAATRQMAKSANWMLTSR